MTDEELRAIDVRVHREVMGLECEDRGGKSGWGYWTKGDYWQEIFKPVPKYTAGGDATWRVVDRLIALGHTLTTGRNRRDERFGAFLDLSDGHDTGDVYAETLPLAICLVALKVPDHLLKSFSPNVFSEPTNASPVP
jgi:hypothetical protein